MSETIAISPQLISPHRVLWASIGIVAGLVIFLAILTAPRVFTAPLWGDELRTWRDGIEKPLSDVLLWRHNADHAPLGHLLARGGAAIFGVDKPWALRLGAWLCGLACVPAMWRLGRAVDSDLVGLLMAALLVSDANIVFQSTQARMYPPLLLAVIVALTAAVRLVTRRDLLPPPFNFLRQAGGGTGIAAVMLAVALTIGLWSHSQIYAVIVPVLLTAMVIAQSPTRRRHAWITLIAIAVALALGAQGVIKLLSRRMADPLDDDNADRPFAQLEDATRALTGQNWITGMLVACAIAGAVVIARRRGRAVAWMLAGVVVMSVLDLLIAARYRPVAFARYLTVMQPALWALVAAFLVELGRFVRQSLPASQARIAIIAIAIAALSFCSYGYSRTRELLPPHPVAGPFRAAIRIAANELSHDSTLHCIVLPRSPYATFARYYGVASDESIFEAVAGRVPRERGRRAKPTTAQASLVEGSTPLTIVGVVPARGAKERSAEDPLAFARAVAAARHLTFPDVPTPDGTLRVVTIHFSADGRVAVVDPHQPARQR